jgi:hypothetical protein
LIGAYSIWQRRRSSMTFSLCGFLLFFFLIDIRCAFFCSYEHL